MKNLKLALAGIEPALLTITDQIQNKKLSEKDEQNILFPDDKNKNNPYLRYLQACIYAFGTQTINPDPNKVKAIINSLVDNIDASAGWAMNLGVFLHKTHPNEYKLEGARRGLEKAARLNNPLAIYNLALDLNDEGDPKEFVSLITQVYERLPKFQHELRLRINHLSALPDTLSNSDLCLALGNFYKKIGEPEQAQLFYLKSQSTEAWVSCQEKTNKESEKNLVKKLQKHLEGLKNINEELKSQFTFNFTPEEIEYIKPISNAVRDRIKIIKYEIDLISASFGDKKNFKNSDLGKLVVNVKNSINEAEKLLEHRDKFIKKVEEEKSHKELGESFAQEYAFSLKREINNLKNENRELKVEIAKLKVAEAKKSESSTEEQKKDENAFLQRFNLPEKK